MLNVFQSNRLEALVTILSKQMSDNALDSVLTPDTILVQSPGMAQWLKLEIAKSNGIAANLAFPLPSSFIWRLYQKTMPDIPEQSPFNKDRMTWILFKLLPQFLTQTEFNALSHFLESAKIDTSNGSEHFYQLRLFQLAEKIADVLDNYLMYRPHWLTHWQEGNNDLPPTEPNIDIEQHAWQAILWREVVRYVEADYDDVDNIPALHRAEMQKVLLNWLAQADKATIQAMVGARVSVFGISTLPEQQLEVLEALARNIEIDVYWFNPCQLYWGDIISPKLAARLTSQQQNIVKINSELHDQYYIVGNPLLASWGKVGKDYLDLLTNRNVEVYDIFIDQADQATRSVLHKIQHDILNLEYRDSQVPLTPQELNSEQGKLVWPQDDTSIQVHICHSRLRELEVLKDNLLHLLAENEGLLASDILVMMPDVNAYSPFIESVFGGLHQGAKYIPYTVADRSGHDLSPSLTAFVDMFLLPESRFTIIEILDLIEVPFMSRLFSFDQDDLNLIRRWVDGCQIKWGISGPHKTKWQMPNRDMNTWQSGLKRMLLGISVGEDALWHDIVSFSEIEGMQAKTLGKLIDFFQFVVTLQVELDAAKTPEQWHHYITELLAYSFDLDTLDEIEQNVLMAIRDVNDKLKDFSNTLRLDQKVSYKIIHRHFDTFLQEDGVTQRFLAGKLNFCSLMPMRSVPFKVVCVLGLNEGEYPRNVDPISFDLVSLCSPKKGDRSRKWDDRYLLLEALCSARDVFYLSYVGISLKNNEMVPPSVLLNEFKDYLCQSYLPTNKQQKLTDSFEYIHRLQPFDSEYYTQSTQSNLQNSYHKQWFDVAKAAHAENNGEELTSSPLTSDQSNLENWFQYSANANDSEINIDQFIEFCRNPIKAFYRQQLDVRYEFYTDTLTEVENFSHNGLTKYTMNLKFIEAALNQQLPSKTLMLQNGQFPSDEWGQRLYKNYSANNEKYTSGLHQVVEIEEGDNIQSTPLSIEYKPAFGNGNITLEADYHLLAGQNVKLRAGRIRTVDIISCWINHLVINASGFEIKSVVYGIEGTSPKWHGFPALSKAYSAQMLNDWLRLYCYSMDQQRLLKWHPETALLWLQKRKKDVSPQELESVLMDAIAEGSSAATIAIDSYSWRLFTKLDDFTPEFFALADKMLLPMLEIGMGCGVRGLKHYISHINQAPVESL